MKTTSNNMSELHIAIRLYMEDAHRPDNPCRVINITQGTAAGDKYRGAGMGYLEFDPEGRQVDLQYTNDLARSMKLVANAAYPRWMEALGKWIVAVPRGAGLPRFGDAPEDPTYESSTPGQFETLPNGNTRIFGQFSCWRLCLDRFDGDKEACLFLKKAA